MFHLKLKILKINCLTLHAIRPLFPNQPITLNTNHLKLNVVAWFKFIKLTIWHFKIFTFKFLTSNVFSLSIGPLTEIFLSRAAQNHSNTTWFIIYIDYSVLQRFIVFIRSLLWNFHNFKIVSLLFIKSGLEFLLLQIYLQEYVNSHFLFG